MRSTKKRKNARENFGLAMTLSWFIVIPIEACFRHGIKNIKKVIVTFYLTILSSFLRIVRCKLAIVKKKSELRDKKKNRRKKVWIVRFKLRIWKKKQVRTVRFKLKKKQSLLSNKNSELCEKKPCYYLLYCLLSDGNKKVKIARCKQNSEEKSSVLWHVNS